jgi:hypothetical protein
MIGSAIKYFETSGWWPEIQLFKFVFNNDNTNGHCKRNPLSDRCVAMAAMADRLLIFRVKFT